MPLGKGTRFRFKVLSPLKAERLAFKGNKVVEVVQYTKSGGIWVKSHNRSMPIRRNY